MYQRLGLDDDIVDPSNTLLREGRVLKISFRRSDPMERYLFLVGAAGGLCTLRRGALGSPGPGGPSGLYLALQEGQGRPWVLYSASMPGDLGSRELPLGLGNF